MFQHVKTDHRVETASGETVEIAVNAQALLKSEAGGTILHKRTILRIEVHKPDMLDTLQACCGKSMGADATAEIKHVAVSELLLKPQGVGDVVGAAEMPGRKLKKVPCANSVFIEISSPLGVEGSRMHGRQVLLALWQTLGNLRR